MLHVYQDKLEGTSTTIVNFFFELKPLFVHLPLIQII